MTIRFQDLQPDDKVYTINPSNQKIIECTVVKAAVHPKSKNRVFYVEFYTPLDNEAATEEAVKVAYMAGTKNTTTKVLVPMKADLVLLKARIPTVLCTSKNRLEKWMQE